MIEAATQGDEEQIVKLLEGGRVNLHYKDWVSHFVPYIYDVCIQVYARLFVLLLFPPGILLKDGDTALHWASIGGHLDSVNVLLQYGANIHATDSVSL